jgi:hypothetical protein
LKRSHCMVAEVREFFSHSKSLRNTHNGVVGVKGWGNNLERIIGYRLITLCEIIEQRPATCK